ncbi:DinB family protein [Ferruginibacter sp. SUN002]|uniref:DinB family protein n=1 Tax=Ferruginibacter sp. SUN002 TaxID=2937789 RepID=UPI003D35FA06
MQIEQNLLIDELVTLTDKAIDDAKKFKSLSDSALNFRRAENEWSALECFEHLNLYGDFYLPEIEKQLLNNKPNSNNFIFKSGILGNFFANSMKVTNGKVNKMKTPRDKNPINSQLSVTTIDRLLKQLEKLKTLLLQARTINLTKAKTSISLSKLIKLRLGDTFRFIVYHNERHILQAQRNIAQQN